jgi:hypothetical protein
LFYQKEVCVKQSPVKAKVFEMANWRGTSATLLAYIGRKYYDDWSIAKMVAGNPRTPHELLERLASHPVRHVRVAVANNRKASEHLYRRLADDKEWFVRWAVAQNPSAPHSILVGFVSDETEDERVTEAAERRLMKRTARRFANQHRRN